MKYVCFDYGVKRTGVAVSDPGGTMVFPRQTFTRGKRESFFAEIMALLAEERAHALVVGLPLLRDGAEGLTARQARNFARDLLRRTALPVFYMDETCSSAEAEDRIKNSGQRFRPGDSRVDSLAAAVILESFLHQPDHLRQRVENNKPPCGGVKGAALK